MIDPIKYGFYFYYEMEAKDIPDGLAPEEVANDMARDMGLVLEDVCNIFPFPDCECSACVMPTCKCCGSGANTILPNGLCQDCDDADRSK